MNTKLIMTLSAILLSLIGITLTFLPLETASYAGMSSSIILQLFIQVLGALYFAFGMLNWMAKGSVIGGIYNRPTVIANFSHFLIGGLALLKGLMNNSNLPKSFWILAAFYSLFAILFGIMLYSNPVSGKRS
jgi:hypothetical protein